MEAEVEQVKVTPTPSRSPSPPPSPTLQGQTTAVTKQAPSVKRGDSLRRQDVLRKGSLRRDQLTGEKRRSRTSSLGSLMGYEAKYPVSV